ncbi:MAG: EamA family transporter [Oscillospiraceae bacterium]|nr:EamA family transporter [Oscillospiraceae bacterium]MCL2278476.1 EamA family transporter [Oscillospiraceae bacterium]
MSRTSKIKTYAVIYLCYLLYSITMVVAKFAGEHPIYSMQALGLYALAFTLFGCFAIIWQQVLKRLPLTVAHANRAVTILYGMIFGAVLFSETISLNMIIGALIIVAGIVLMVKKHE